MGLQRNAASTLCLFVICVLGCSACVPLAPFGQACACPVACGDTDGDLRVAGGPDRLGEADSDGGMRKGDLSKGYLVKKLNEVEPVPCLCGSSTTPITIKDAPPVEQVRRFFSGKSPMDQVTKDMLAWAA